LLDSLLQEYHQHSDSTGTGTSQPAVKPLGCEMASNGENRKR